MSNGHQKRRQRDSAVFLLALGMYGTARLACEAAHVSESTVYAWRRADPEFAAAWCYVVDLRRRLIEALSEQGHTNPAPGVVAVLDLDGAKLAVYMMRHAGVVGKDSLKAHAARLDAALAPLRQLPALRVAAVDRAIEELERELRPFSRALAERADKAANALYDEAGRHMTQLLSAAKMRYPAAEAVKFLWHFGAAALRGKVNVLNPNDTRKGRTRRGNPSHRTPMFWLDRDARARWKIGKTKAPSASPKPLEEGDTVERLLLALQWKGPPGA